MTVPSFLPRDSAVLPREPCRAAACPPVDSFRFMIQGSVSHDPREEDLDSKVRWFSTLSPDEQLRTLLEWSEAMQKLNPAIREVGRHAAVPGRIQILERP